MEELENSKIESTRLAKKRKIRKAAQSHNTRDDHQKRVEDMQNKRLQKMKIEAEQALFANAEGGADLEKGQLKKKKKNVKKDFVKKEINYWLDYDSPYSEYLVARFREWSPNPNINNNNHIRVRILIYLINSFRTAHQVLRDNSLLLNSMELRVSMLSSSRGMKEEAEKDHQSRTLEAQTEQEDPLLTTQVVEWSILHNRTKTPKS